MIIFRGRFRGKTHVGAIHAMWLADGSRWPGSNREEESECKFFIVSGQRLSVFINSDTDKVASH